MSTIKGTKCIKLNDGEDISDESDEVSENIDEVNTNVNSCDDANTDSDILTGSARSILTFNASVSNKKLVVEINNPYQIMASTRNYLTTTTINSYPEAKNPDLLLHMNYITRPFNDNAIESNSRERVSLRQYAKLAKRLGTRDVLIHMPTNITEYENIAQGMSIIKDELIEKGVVCHLEISAWSQELLKYLDVRKQEPFKYVSEFIDRIVDLFTKFPKNAFMIVLDTAHLYAVGCEVQDQIKLFHKYRQLMKYCHLNGNVNAKFTSDSHAPIMSSKSRMKDWDKLSKCIASMGLICVAEITKYGLEWEEWEKYAKEFGFNLVPYHKQYSF